MNGKQLKQLGIQRDLAVAAVTVDSVEEVVLFVVVGGEDNKVDDALKDL
jgi:hypothetical protein